jgi:hypothetical protein
LKGRSRPPFRRALAEIESEICSGLITAFVRSEHARPAFTIVAMEKDREAELGGLPLHIRPDRVDELGAGTRIVIDYKTGEIGTGQWLGDRPEEPQLPIYALLLEADAIAFVQLRRAGIAWAGLARRDVGIPGVIEPAKLRRRNEKYADWAALRSAWQRRLLGMAAEILGGDARIHRGRGRRALAEGQWAMLTRIYESAGDDEAEEEAGE